MSGASADPWLSLRQRTPARLALGRAGASLPTRAVLDFALDHARARDAVHATLDTALIEAELRKLGLETQSIESNAADRGIYLRRPDLGRTLSDASRRRLATHAAPADIALMVGDGLSATAVSAHAAAVLAAFLPHLTRLRASLAVTTLARGARVALGDEVGQCLGARLMIVLIGERPGLSAADSLGIYLTYDPKPGRRDAERNCISNVRTGGLDPARAAANLAWLVEAALLGQATGVGLKDESDGPALIPGDSPAG